MKSTNEVIVPIAAIHDNVAQSVITITEDKLRLALDEHREAIASGRSWIPVLGIFATLAITLTTSTPNSNVEAWWRPVYGGATFCSFVWLLSSIWASIRSHCGLSSVDDVIDRIKNVPNE